MVDSVQRMPLTTPTWATDSGVALEPSLAERQAGWPEGFKPPARWQNDYQRKVFQIVDNAMAAQRKDWRETRMDDTVITFGLDVDSSALCFHKGYYYIRGASSSWIIYRSSDLKGWQSLGAPLVLAQASLTIASNGTRMVFTAAGVVGNSQYSDTDGNTFAGAIVGAGSDPRVYYLPANDIWVGSGSTINTFVSADGITYAATDFLGFAFTGNMFAAEKPDGSIALVGGQRGIFSVNSGVNWANTTTALALDGYYYSEIVGDLVAVTTGNGLRKMSSTPGTWESVDFGAFPAGWNHDGMFDLNGAMYSYGTFADPDTPALAAITGIIMSLDQGTTWEFVFTINESAQGAGLLSHLIAVQPVVGHRPGANTGFVGLASQLTSSVSVAFAPPYPGQTFAAELT